jgi:KTSC domain
MKRTFLLILSVGLLSGCGNSSEPASSPQVEAQTVVGTNGQLIAIESDNVRAAGYNALALIMTVQFNNGYTYEYYGVQPELWNSFIAAQPHPWSQVGHPRLVEGGVPYKRIS